MDSGEFDQFPLLGILRGIRTNEVAPLADTIVSSGLRTVEITMNTPDAARLIRQMKSAAGKKLTIGAGTVLGLDDLKSALGAGATFIVSPVLVPEVVAYCVKRRIPVFPGALTPSEIYAAWQSGATMVKVFPLKFFGPDYLKEIKAPFAQIKLLACGGVTAANLKSYFDNGASAAAFGASVFKSEWLKNRNFKRIGAEIRKFARQIK